MGQDEFLTEAGKEFGKEAAKIVPEVYEDLLQPTIRETGKIGALVPRAINAALCNFHIWLMNKEYAMKMTEKLLEVKLKNVDPDKIITPAPYVAVPALQAISYSMDSEELRNMYANLLANSMNIDIKDKVHPCFVEIIKQMSPNDANVLNKIIQAQTRPLISLYIVSADKKTERQLLKNVIWFYLASGDITRESIDNLIRCRLIEIDKKTYADKTLYNSILEAPFYKNYKNQIEEQIKSSESPTETLREDLYQIVITHLGKSFYEICMQALD